jgi:hypothetical protein
MNTKELILAVAKQTNLPAAEVDKVSRAVLDTFAALIETQGSFQSPYLQVIGTVAPAKPASEDTPATPERKFARLRVPPRKPRG